MSPLGQTLHFDVGQPLPILPQLRTCHCTVLTDVLCQNPTSLKVSFSPIPLKKSFLAYERNFSAPRVRPTTRRREGPDRFAQEQSRIFVPARQSLTATEKVRNCLSRDFRSCSIFDFFNSIDPKRTWGLTEPVMLPA